ncbi:MAG: hypothetical protein ACOC29_01065, partial [Candidatus Sumerlaeota bacterium]
ATRNIFVSNGGLGMHSNVNSAIHNLLPDSPESGQENIIAGKGGRVKFGLGIVQRQGGSLGIEKPCCSCLISFVKKSLTPLCRTSGWRKPEIAVNCNFLIASL